MGLFENLTHGYPRGDFIERFTMAAKNENAPPPSSTSHGSSSGDASGGGTSSDSVKSKSTSGGDFQVLYQQPQRPTSTSTSMTTSTLSVLEQKKSEKDAKEMKIRSMLNSVTEQEAALEIMKGLTEMATATRPQKRVSFRRQEISVIPEEYERSESSEPKVASQLQGDTPLEVRKFHDDDTVSEMTDSHTVTSSVFTVGSSVRSDKEIKRTPANESNVVIPKEEDWLPHDQPMFQIKRSATNDGIKRAALSNKGVEVESRRDGNLPREDSTITMDHDSCEYEYTAPLKQSSYSQSQSSSSHSSLVTGPQPASLSTEDTGPQPTGYYQMSSSDTSASPWKVSSSDTSASPWRDISSISDADGATAASVANSEDAIAASTMSVDTIETNYFTDTNTEGYSEAAVTTVSAVYSDAVSSYVHSDDAVVVSLQSIDTIATHPHVAPITIAPSTVTASKLVNAVAAAADTATGGDSQFAATSRPPLANSNDHQPSAAAAGDNTKAPRRTKMKKKKSSKKKVNTNLEGITTATTHLATVQTAPRGIGTDQQQQKLSASLIPLAATTPASHQKQRPPRHASKQNKAASDGAIMRRAQLEKARIRAQDENLARQAQSDPTMRYQSSEQFEFSRSGALGGGGDPMEPSSGFMSQTRFGSPHSSSASLHQSSHLRHGDYNSRRDVLAGNDYSTTGGGSGDTTVRRSHVGKKTLADEYKRAPASYPLTPNFSMGPPPPYLPHGDLEPGSIEDQIEEGSNDDGVGYFNLFAAEARTPKSTRSRIIFFAILCFLFVAGGGIAVAIIMTQSESTPDPPASAPTALPEEQAWSSDELLALLKREPAVDIQAVEFPGTPQAKAFTWLQNESNHEDGVLSDEKSVLQRFAFATLYYSTAGDNWVENTGWLSAAHECVWTTDIIWPCDLNREMLKLELVANALSGSLPGEIGLLSKLQVIHLSGNKKIEKEIPLSIWTLPNLSKSFSFSLWPLRNYSDLTSLLQHR